MSAGGGTKAIIAVTAPIDEADSRIRVALPVARVIHLEPEIFHADAATTGASAVGAVPPAQA